MQIGKAARSNGSHIKSRLKMEPHGVFKEVTKQCTNKDHYQSVSGYLAWEMQIASSCYIYFRTKETQLDHVTRNLI